jgi:ABC-type spermidine/putrescine transport system permease subunit I
MLLQVFWHVTLPNIRWGLLYGVILTNARAMGEFGAVSVISGARLLLLLLCCWPGCRLLVHGTAGTRQTWQVQCWGI